MYTIGIRDLKNHTSEVVQRVRAGERVALTYHGKVIAHLVPVAAESAAERTRSADRIAGYTPETVP